MQNFIDLHFMKKAGCFFDVLKVLKSQSNWKNMNTVTAYLILEFTLECMTILIKFCNRVIFEEAI